MHAADKAPASRTPLPIFLHADQVAPTAPVHLDVHDLCTGRQASRMVAGQQWASHKPVYSITTSCRNTTVKLSEQTQHEGEESQKLWQMQQIAAIAAHASIEITPMTHHLLLGHTASMLDIHCCIERTMLAWCNINRP